MKLRPYQREAVDSIWKYFASGKEGNPIVVMPTATGKSLIIADFIKKVYAYYPNQRMMMITHVKELIVQNFEKLLIMCPTCPAGIYSAGLKQKDTHAKITFAGIQSVVKTPVSFGHIDLIFIDECHLVNPGQTTSYQKFISALKVVNPHLKVIGLSATPYRLGQGLLTDSGLFTDVCYDLSERTAFNKLISDGYLSPAYPTAVIEEIDTSNIRTQGGEFVNKDLQQAVDQEEITKYALSEVIRKGSHKKHWLIFAVGIEHTEHCVEFLRRKGITAAYIHSKMPTTERDTNLRAFKNHEIQAIVNMGVLTTGFDFPEIDLIVLLRPTKSTSLHVQMIGRGTRPVYAAGFDLETKEGRLAAIKAGPKAEGCLVLDFAGNTKRLGPINDPILPSRKKKGKGGGLAPVKLCEQCGTYCHASVKVCDWCGFEFPTQVKFSAFAGTDAIIAKDIELPVIETFPISKVLYLRHKKAGKPDSMKVVYSSGLRSFTKYICIAYDGYAGRKARQWWEGASYTPELVPNTADSALELAPQLKMPKSINVHVNCKYPEVLSIEY